MNSCIILAVALAGITQCFGEVVIDKSTTCGHYTDENKDCYSNSDATYKLKKLQYITNYDGVEGALSVNANLTLICAEDLTVLKPVSSCLVNSYRKCADNDFKTLIPTAEQYSSAIEYACNNKDALQSIYNCFGDSITDCIFNKKARQSLTDGAEPDRSNEFSVWTKYHCGRRDIELECRKIDEDFKDCSNADYTIYEELMSKLKPKACNGVKGLMYTTSLLLVSVFSLLHRYF
ncbi:hypothetical protein LOTGIDRAFT_233527 [Lottia gigantea]|uniref:Uncharacterized protein n=1 Tax=Lottia gigantea TaxID=225164 RepID=V4A2W7_LOTGI|nr:hypothetical protein LOTGIDRAFT_233527 [Lottia gigantea]ESO91042.1 hypothetical protein LOTGIDRAFT_233527 [Lottia gigantea]